ncbi:MULTISPECIES: CHAT domain-containing protein [unclassified Streptomyces]|uniref:CHAT domain-containing protein n=1 Tax=unclassified Streptomyces TaxID=2593676 RepID=UPI001655EAF8|nr:CHAT domain-containing protein [Streptomyces sp. CB02980]MCB8901246.1 CHAT domain-containing protein [Streptomyces sp. CB02980]
MAVTRRDDLLRALAARVLLFRTNMDGTAVLDPEALRMARELMRHVPDPSVDLEAVLTLADLHRCRSVLLGDEAGREDAAIATALERYAGQGEADPDPETAEATARVAALHARAREGVLAAERHRDRGRLESAILACEAAVDGTPVRARPLRASALALWGVALRLRYEREGRSEDLDDAVTALRRAEAAAGTGHPERNLVLSGLSAALRERYELRGALDDLMEAVRVARAAVDEGGPEGRGGRLHNLGLALRLRHERTGDPTDLAQAVAVHREAVALAPPGHRDHTLLQQGLANALRVRHEHTAAEADVRERLDALEAAQAKGVARPDGGVGPADTAGAVGASVGALVNLASALTERYQLDGRPEDADRAESLLRTAAESVPARHPLHAGVQYQLGLVLAARKRPGAAAALRAAALHPTAAPLTRLRAAHAWGFEAMAAHRPEEAAVAYGHALARLPALASRHLPLVDAERALAESRGLAGDAAACALAAGDPTQALRLLESGRGVLLGQGLGRHDDDLARLRAQDPRTADRLAWLRTRLNAEGPDEAEGPEGPEGPEEAEVPAGSGDGAGATHERHALVSEWERTLAGVRRRDGFEDFLLPPDPAGLLAEGADGPVVLVNVSRFRCDALAITAGGLRTVPLPRLALHEVVHRTTAFLGALERLQAADEGDDLMAGPAAEDEIDGHLGWLWDTITGPVLDALGITGTPAGERPPRVWWIPTGPLAFLPLHAAGHHREAGGRTVLDRTVPSYAPTVRALAAGRCRTPAPPPSFLVVAVADAPGARPLPGAAGEGAAVVGALPGARLLSGEAATRDAVVTALTDHTWLHFCGHGTSEPLTAVGSRLLVHDHLDHPLTVAGISRLDLSGAELAYLSACGTARSGFTVMDEGLHLAGGLQLAGFRHVVGTLWEIDDTMSVRIAEQVYAGLGAPNPVADRAAYAVREAVRGVRDRYPRTPSLWAAHIHVGP